MGSANNDEASGQADPQTPTATKKPAKESTSGKPVPKKATAKKAGSNKAESEKLGALTDTPDTAASAAGETELSTEKPVPEVELDAVEAKPPAEPVHLSATPLNAAEHVSRRTVGLAAMAGGAALLSGGAAGLLGTWVSQGPKQVSAATPGGLSVPSPSPPPLPPPELPRGGREVFPKYRLVGYCGAPHAPALGRMMDNLDERTAEAEKLAQSYVGAGVNERQILPVLELITIVVQGSPGRDGKFRTRQDDTVIQSYLDAARRHRALLLLNVQPGRARMSDEVRALEKWLVEPDIGLALDPEWSMGPNQIPMRQFGHIDGAHLDEINQYVSQLVDAHNLPEKVVVVHQLAPTIISHWPLVVPRPGVAMALSVDGIGNKAQKTDTWTKILADKPEWVRPGFKLFFQEDPQQGGRGSQLMTPAEVLALTPTPDYVLYE